MRLIYPFDLPKLPYNNSDMYPYISELSIQIHYDKNHRAYVDKANSILKDLPQYHNDRLALLLTQVKGSLFNNLAQHFNHTLWWFSIKPPQSTSYDPPLIIQKMMIRDFGSVDNWRTDFINKGKDQFGNGWIWTCVENGKLINITTANAGIPNFFSNRKPILICDIWEHAYFCDFNIDKEQYIKNFMHCINWQMCEVRLRNEDIIFNLY